MTCLLQIFIEVNSLKNGLISLTKPWPNLRFPCVSKILLRLRAQPLPFRRGVERSYIPVQLRVQLFFTVSNANYKQKLFRRAVKSGTKKGYSGVELLAPIYESNSDDFIRSLPTLPSVRGSRLDVGETHMFASILARRGDAKIRILDLQDCGIDNSRMNIIVQNIKGKNIQVRSLCSCCPVHSLFNSSPRSLECVN